MKSSLINRRSLLKFAGSAGLISTVPWCSLYGGANDVAHPVRTDGRIALVFHEATEVLICGSTLFAIELALQTAKAGKRTVLAMERVNPLFEHIACLQSWCPADAIPELLRSVCSNSKTSTTIAGRCYYNQSQAILDIENQLCDAGVRFCYNAAVAGALGTTNGRVVGAVFGGKTGLFAIEAGVVIDATPEATLARAAGAQTTPQRGPRRYHYVADLSKPVDARPLQYVSVSGARIAVNVHHYYAEFSAEIDSQTNGPFAQAEDFRRVYAASLECPWQGSEQRFRGADGFLTSGVDRLEATAPGRVTGADGVLVFGPQGIPDNRNGSLVLRDPLALQKAFPNARENILSALAPVERPRPLLSLLNRGVSAESKPPTELVHNFLDHGFSEAGSETADVQFQPPEISLQAEVMVAGGGTSGNAASYAAATLGLKTMCLERALELGGTNTIGGVTNLWHGNKTIAFENYFRAMDATNDGLNAPGFFRGLEKSGCQVLFNSGVTGVACVGRQVRRIYVLTPCGLAAVAAPRMIDATGDGSIAAWSGCGYTFGGEHDEMTLWASFAGYRPGKPEALRPFLSPCDERSPWDATRFILSMRRNGRINLNGPHVPPPFYLAPRESRHINGGRTLTYLDTLAGRRYRDGVFRVESNPDIKGLATSDAAKAGFIPTDWNGLFQVTVPYSAMIPVAIDNVIIAGKAYSVTHDALALARMQRDLCIMGMAAAEAVLISQNKNVLLRDVPMAQLQLILINKGMLKPSDIAEDDFGFDQSVEEMATIIAANKNLDACLPASAQLCLLPREKSLAALARHTQVNNPALNRVLSFLKDPVGITRYTSEVADALKAKELSQVLFGVKGTGHMMPDQGYAPDSALMLASLVLAKAPQAVSLLVQLADRAPLNSKDLRFSWGYLYTIACGFERLACDEGRAPLQRLLAAPLFADRIVSRHGDLRKARDTISERFAYLRLALARALTRCGDVAGAMILCDMLDESRLCFARSARAELVAASGTDLGFAADAWKKWLQNNSASLKPNPLTTPFA